MSQLTATPERRTLSLWEALELGRMSKPELSRSVLLATTFVVSLGLLVWLLLFIFIRHGGPVEGYWVAQRGMASPILPFQASDLGRVLGRPPGNPPADVPSRELGALVRERMARSGDGLAVIFLSAAGVSDGRRPLLLATNHRPVDSPGDPGRAGLNADDRLDLLNEPPSKGGKCLLILDAAQIGTDRNLGVFGNGFVQRLATMMKEQKPRGLMVLSSCAPGQVSWTSEADRQTVFGHFVARGLSGDAAGWDRSSRGLTARGLAAYVRHYVERWVSEKRGAQQTPILLSADETENFPLRPSVPPSALRADRMDPEAADELQKRLGDGWVRRNELETMRPFRHAPLLWRRYQETLLRAERLWRAGQDAEAKGILGDLAGLERKLTERLDATAFAEPLSLALAEAAWAAVPPSDREKAAKYRETISEAISELAGEADSRSVGSKVGPDRELPEATPGSADAKPASAAISKGQAAGNEEAVGKEQATGETTSTGRGPTTPKKAKPGEAEPDAGAKIPERREVRPLATPRLTIDGDEGRPAFLEGQVLVWAAAFQKLGASRHFGSTDFFAGRRAQLLHDLVDLRTAAEIAAAGDERVRHWTAPLVDFGDAIRRKAQDRLFAGGSSRGDGPTTDLGDVKPQRARELYDQGAREAELYSKSLDLVQRLGSELPYLGEWLARRNARLGLDGLGDDFETLLDDTANLVDLIIVDPRTADEGQTSRSAVDEVLRSHATRVKAVKERVDRTGASYDRLKALLLKHCREQAEAEGPEHWRELDDLLSVPMIPAEVRLPLVRKVRGSLASSLDG
jgi:Caspase domain